MILAKASLLGWLDNSAPTGSGSSRMYWHLPELGRVVFNKTDSKVVLGAAR